jgi:hypothetical protein
VPARAEGRPVPPKEEIPGAVPSDEELAGLLRRFIRPTNDEAAVNQVIVEVEARIKDKPELRKQAVDGWTRILHFENYGTAYSRKAGREFLEKLQRDSK